MANFFLDELIKEKTTERKPFLEKNPVSGLYEGLFIKSFTTTLEFATCDELQQSENGTLFREEAQQVYNNLRHVIEKIFPHPSHQINREEVVIEPSYLSADYGIQGRLDLYHFFARKAKIVELKSGKPPWPEGNHGLIGPNHQTQLLLYNLC